MNRLEDDRAVVARALADTRGGLLTSMLGYTPTIEYGLRFNPAYVSRLLDVVEAADLYVTVVGQAAASITLDDAHAGLVAALDGVR